jgi:aminopeptidase N
MYEACSNEIGRKDEDHEHENGPKGLAASYHLLGLSRRSYIFLGLVAGLLAMAWVLRDRQRAGRSGLTPVVPTDGISLRLAEDRARNITALRYDLTLNIPEGKQEPIRGRETIAFQLQQSSRPLLIDFAQPVDRVLSLIAGSQKISVASSHGHLIIPPASLHRGDNQIVIEFIAGDLPLNRNDDYLYSLFVPARASQAVPCFDQPDLKASLTLTLDIPSSWQAVANGFERGRETAAGRTVVRFAPTQPLPTYLFGFAAGKFTVEYAERNGRAFRLYHRETDRAKVERNLPAIFDLHEQAIEWLEDYTARKYPFEKMDFVLIPAFQFSGMEHAGAIFYNASALFLDQTATQEQELARASTIAHETSHMWFGDLVTMKWFDDVWMKEVFANFMAAKIVNPSFPNINHELRFLLQHYPSAYDVDRTSGANPIRQHLENLNEAGSLYGNIIYDKAPIVMRQLEEMVGPDGLRDGLREYLTRFAFHNATWTDLIHILDPRTSEDLAAWSHAWVEEPGRPTITTDVKIDDGHVTGLAFIQSDPRGRPLIWNQRLQVALGFPNGVRITPLHMNATRVQMPMPQPLPQPLYILPNGEGAGYGLFRPESASKTFFLEHLPEIGDPITRAAGWLTLWDDMLEAGTPPNQVIELALRSLPLEQEEQNVQRVLSYLGEAYWLFISDAERAAIAPRVEAVLRAGIQKSEARSLKAAYFGAFRRNAITHEGVAYLERVWRRQELIAGLPLAEPDYIAMAQELAVRNVPKTESILAEQLGRIENPDRRARFAFITPALEPDAAIRDSFFASLANVGNRRHEPWVIDALSYLNHPLRAQQSERYIRPSLDLLVEIQRTGDIFFPIRWTDAALTGHHSPTAAQIVGDFLSQQKELPPRLRQVVEQSADTLLRASRLVPREDQR